MKTSVLFKCIFLLASSQVLSTKMPETSTTPCHEPKTVTLDIDTNPMSFSYNGTQLSKILNAIPIDGIDSEPLGHKDDKLIVKVSGLMQDGRKEVTFEGTKKHIYTEHLELNQALFKAAVDELNIARLNELITKGFHRLLSDEDKIIVFKKALVHLNNSEFSRLELFSLLLQAGFYIPPESLPHPNSDWIAPLKPIFKHENVMQTFLEYDPDFFKKIKGFNYVSYLLEDSRLTKNTDIIDYALMLDCDPSIVYNGQNTLDKALELRARNYVSAVTYIDQDYLANLIRTLRTSYNLKESDNVINISRCFLYERFDSALKLLKTGTYVPMPNDDFFIASIWMSCPKTEEYQSALRKYLYH